MSGNRLRLEALEDRWNLSPLAGAVPEPTIDPRATDSFSLNYAKIEFSYTPQKETGTLEAPSEGSPFSTVASVTHDSEEISVGQRVNYDKLVLEIWTNGEVPTQDFHFVAMSDPGALDLTATDSGERSGTGGGAGKVQMQDAHFVAKASKASPKLFLACATGSHIAEAGAPSDLAADTETEPDAAGVQIPIKVKHGL